MGKQGIVLKDGIDVALPGREFAGVFAKDSYRAAAQLFETGNQAQAGGFAGARRPQHGEKLPVTDPDRYSIHRTHIAIQAGDIVKLYCVGHIPLPALNDRP